MKVQTHIKKKEELRSNEFEASHKSIVEDPVGCVIEKSTLSPVLSRRKRRREKSPAECRRVSLASSRPLIKRPGAREEGKKEGAREADKRKERKEEKEGKK